MADVIKWINIPRRYFLYNYKVFSFLGVFLGFFLGGIYVAHLFRFLYYVFSHIMYWLASNFNLSALYELVMLRSNGYNFWWRIQVARLFFSYFHVKMFKECWSTTTAISIKWTTNYLWSQIIEHIDQEDVSLWKFRHWLVTGTKIWRS
jgi:hypothetical protein